MSDAAADGKERVNILLVDDQPAKLLSYEAILAPLDENLLQAHSAKEALECLLRAEIAVVLVDVCMPELDGFELAALIRQHPRFQKTAIILVSAVLMADMDRLKGYASGATDYVAVPVVPEVLRAKVAVFVDLYRKTRQLERLNRELEQRVAERTGDLEASLLRLQESEQRFRNMADTAPAMLWITDTAARYSFFSHGWYEFTGFVPQPGSEYARLEAVHAEDQDGTRDAFLAAHGRREPFQLYYRLRRAEGDFRWVVDAGRPRFAESGEFLGYIGSVIDITERRRAEVRLQEADRRKDEFLALLAHELRNPLAPIRNILEILRLNGDDARVLGEGLDVMERQLRHLVRLVDDLLDVSRISQGKLTLRCERLRLRAVLEAALEASRPALEAAGHQLSVSFPEEDLYLDGDQVRLSQALGNLLSNAAKYTPRGGCIAVQAGLEDGAVMIRVRDTGIGIPPEMLERVFDLFTQVERERSQGGLGIGLTLVRRIVELHGGSVQARSAGRDQGSEFVIRLPRVAAPPVDTAEPLRSAPPPLQVPALRMLVADDNRDAADSLSALLQLSGNEVQTAYDGREAVALANAFRPRVIFLDLGMPQLTGYDAACQIRKQPWAQDAVLVALSGWGREEDRRRSREAGFAAHLTKPVDFATMLALLQELVRREKPTELRR
ncbi:MAG: response regulator [Planctomycetota bacterium]|nr:MAG: response regulator [Planctomycetota bacterium]